MCCGKSSFVSTAVFCISQSLSTAGFSAASPFPSSDSLSLELSLLESSTTTSAAFFKVMTTLRCFLSSGRNFVVELTLLSCKPDPSHKLPARLSFTKWLYHRLGLVWSLCAVPFVHRCKRTPTRRVFYDLPQSFLCVACMCFGVAHGVRSSVCPQPLWKMRKLEHC